MKRQRDHLRLIPEPQPNGAVPPHDLDLEAAVLSACLLSRSALLRVMDIVKPWDFFSDDNGRIFRVASELAAQEQPIDIVLVHARLRDQGFPHILSYLSQIVDATPSVANVEAHAERLSELGQRRRLIATCQRIAASGYADVGEHTDWIRGIEESIAELTTLRAADHMSELREAVSWAFGELRATEERQGKIIGLSTGLGPLDELTAGMHGGAMTLVGAVRGGGKTALASCIELAVCSAADADGELRNGVLLLSLEMPRGQITTRLTCTAGRVNWHRVRTGNATREDWSQLFTAGEWLRTLPMLIDDQPAITVAQMRSKIARAIAHFEARDKRLALVVIDYLQLMNGRDGCEPGANRERQVSFIGESIKATATALKTVPVLALTQLNADGVARESSALEMHADDMWLVETDEPQKSRFDGDRVAESCAARVKIPKQRMGPKNVTAHLHWFPQFTMFSGGPTP